MSTQEHYFENLLFAYVQGVDIYNDCKQEDPNIEWLSDEEKSAIETCAAYIIDCCGWNNDVVRDFLDGEFTPSFQ